MEFRQSGERVTVPIRGRLLISNFAAQREAALRGVGLAILPLLSVREDLEVGRLVSVLPDYEVYRGELSLVRPPTPFEPPSSGPSSTSSPQPCASGRATIHGD